MFTEASINEETSQLTSQFSSVAQLCPTLCDPMGCSMPGSPRLLDFSFFLFVLQNGKSRQMQWQQLITYRCSGNCAWYFSTVDTHHGRKCGNYRRGIIQTTIFSKQIWESEHFSLKSYSWSSIFTSNANWCGLKIRYSMSLKNVDGEAATCYLKRIFSFLKKDCTNKDLKFVKGCVC